MKDVEARIQKYLTDRDWHNLRPADLAKSIVIEAAELLELFQWSNATLEETKADKRKIEQLKGELADVLIYALDMAVLLGLDTKQIIIDKLEKIDQKYPAHLIKNAKKSSEPGTDSLYLKLKQDHRRQNGKAYQ